MASVLFVNALQVNFNSMLTMEHSGMVKMFKSLEDSGLIGFLNNCQSRGCSMYSNTAVEIRRQFSGSDEPFMAPNKKRDMPIEFRLLHDIVAKALCAKSGSFDQVTSEKLDLMIANTAGLKQMKQSAKEEATSYGDSADGLEVDDVIGDVIQSQESAGSLHSRRKKKRRRRGSSRKLQCNQQMLLELARAKRCRLHKLIRQRFAIAIKIQQEDFALLFQQTKLQCPVATQRYPVARLTSRKLYASSRKLWFRIKKRRSRRSVEIKSVERFSRNILAVAREKQLST
ncbi:protein ROOT PRIMORDIUM DEFECTIVE 1 [Dorcoceras hygrometricum]|uniref:Protein ROOT PRIMORDIUM DEFECTIVE 1 n=1 Tax=Dorcoceras hygrometricum TaxID=472368 RepID=A0A2Z7CYZ8_9LAMI|nr:protein ROOT PRIMORDIUM DEFECTIVE 1 [Dorcoceras hygrometricum]